MIAITKIRVTKISVGALPPVGAIGSRTTIGIHTYTIKWISKR